LNQIIETKTQPYPFLFFCEERFSTECTLALIAEMYEEVAKYSAPRYILSIGELASACMNVFVQESYARIILYGDYEEDKPFGAEDQVQQYYEDLVDSEGISLGNFIERISNESHMFSMDQTYSKNFRCDLQYGLGLLNIVHFDMESSVEVHGYFWKAGDPLLSDHLKNAVLKEVW
jgi:hypothetical protein